MYIIKNDLNSYSVGIDPSGLKIIAKHNDLLDGAYHSIIHTFKEYQSASKVFMNMNLTREVGWTIQPFKEGE